MFFTKVPEELQSLEISPLYSFRRTDKVGINGDN